jgi:GNAT superfamily N-acetyltransferase
MGGDREEPPPGTPLATRRVLAPVRLRAEHDPSAFANGRHATLDDWLRDRALASEGLSARTYVICDAAAPARVVGYYALSLATEQRVALPTAKLRRGMPEKVPLLLIGRLAVDVGHQGIGLGRALLADALRRCVAASEIAGARAILTHAIDDDAVGFYRRHGFLLSPLGARVLLLPIETVSAVRE